MTRTRVLKAAVALAAAAASLVAVLPGLAADGITPASVSLTLNSGATSTPITKSVHLDAAPAKADIVLAVDTTGSMSAAISQAKTDATNIVTGVQALIPGARFAVVNFDDYPFDPFGNAAAGDVPYQLLQTLTANAPDVQTAINSLSLHDGRDYPESYNRVFYESYSDPTLVYDASAVKLLVVLGDSVPHDATQNADFAACPDTPPTDPGPDAIVGTTDDLFTKATLNGMVTNNIKLLFVNYGFDACHHALATYTGGSDVAAGSGGSLASEIVALVQAAAAHIGTVTLDVSPASFASWLAETPTPPYGPFTAPVDFGWTETITAPAATAPGSYEFDVNVVADGAVRATQHVAVRVNAPPVCGDATAGPDLWPPNHKLSNPIAVTGVTDPDGDTFAIHIDSIFQDEPTAGLGDGDTSPDATILGTNSFNVRAERSGTANGRMYYVNFTATDAVGGTCTGTATIGVAHDQESAPIGDGQLYPST